MLHGKVKCVYLVVLTNIATHMSVLSIAITEPECC